MNDNIDNYDDFLKNFFSYGVIIRSDFETIKQLKKYLSDQQIIVCFQKMSTNKLFIKEIP